MMAANDIHASEAVFVPGADNHRAFRNALGSFTTGVTVVTAMNATTVATDRIAEATATTATTEVIAKMTAVETADATAIATVSVTADAVAQAWSETISSLKFHRTMF